MKDKKTAANLVLRAMQSADSTVSLLEDNQTITGYYGFTELDVSQYVQYIEAELRIKITDEDIENRMSTTIGESVKFLTELTLENE